MFETGFNDASQFLAGCWRGDRVNVPLCRVCKCVFLWVHNVIMSRLFQNNRSLVIKFGFSLPPKLCLPPSASHLLTPPSTVLTSRLPEHWRHTCWGHKALVCVVSVRSSLLNERANVILGTGRRWWLWMKRTANSVWIIFSSFTCWSGGRKIENLN